MKTDDFYIEENRITDSRKEYFSPSRKYKLIVDSYKTKQGCWNCTRGIVYKGTEVICDIKRNYSSFHHSFIVKDNQEWLITGKSYMGQTFVNLETGKIIDDEKYKANLYTGNEFCWAAANLLPNEILMVLGCHWAGPYMYTFFDFSNPETGWPEIKVVRKIDSEHFVEEFIYDNEDKSPEYKDGKLYVYKTSKKFLPLNKLDDDITSEDLKNILDKDYENPNNWLLNIEKTDIFEFKDGIIIKLCETG